MKNRTDEEIQAKLKELWRDECFRDTEYEITRGANYVDLRVSQMYESPGLDFQKLVELSRFFDTMNVETESEFSHGGCETCDYGSEYGFTLRVRAGAPFSDLVSGAESSAGDAL